MPTLAACAEKVSRMSITTVTSREFNQDVSKAKRKASQGPVFITDRGHPTYVLLSIEDYQRIASQQQSIIDLLAMPDGVAIEFEAPKLDGEFFRHTDLS